MQKGILPLLELEGGPLFSRLFVVSLHPSVFIDPNACSLSNKKIYMNGVRSVTPQASQRNTAKNNSSNMDLTEQMVVEEMEPKIEIIPFAVSVSSSDVFLQTSNSLIPTTTTTKPASIIEEGDESSDAIESSTSKQNVFDSVLNNQGIVGTITFLGPKSIMIWFGWGPIMSVQDEVKEQEPSSTTKSKCLKSMGGSVNRSMGPLFIGIPTTNQSSSYTSATSKLIGHTSTHIEMICQQMASRLSQRLNDRSVLVSCNLMDGMAPNLISAEGTMDEEYIYSRCAAIAEKEVYRIVKERTNN